MNYFNRKTKENEEKLADLKKALKIHGSKLSISKQRSFLKCLIDFYIFKSIEPLFNLVENDEQIIDSSEDILEHSDSEILEDERKEAKQYKKLLKEKLELDKKIKSYEMRYAKRQSLENSLLRESSSGQEDTMSISTNSFDKSKGNLFIIKENLLNSDYLQQNQSELSFLNSKYTAIADEKHNSYEFLSSLEPQVKSNGQFFKSKGRNMLFTSSPIKDVRPKFNFRPAQFILNSIVSERKRKEENEAVFDSVNSSL